MLFAASGLAISGGGFLDPIDGFYRQSGKKRQANTLHSPGATG
jgi:hypothetical protein